MVFKQRLLTNPFSMLVLYPPDSTFPAAGYRLATLSTAKSLTGGTSVQAEHQATEMSRRSHTPLVHSGSRLKVSLFHRRNYLENEKNKTTFILPTKEVFKMKVDFFSD